MQPQYSQGAAPSHHPPPYAPPEISQASGGSITSSLRQWRKKDYVEKQQSSEAPPTAVTENPSHVARVAPRTYYPRPTNEVCHYQHQYAEYGVPYKPPPPAPVKYSEIVDNQQAQTIEHITPVIPKHKDKEYADLCSVPPQPHLKQYQEHMPLKQPYPDGAKQTYSDPAVHHHQYIPKESQIHTFIQKQPQMHQYIQKEQYQQYMPKYAMQNQYPQSYPSEPNNFLAHLNKINPRMAQSIINDTHLRDNQIPMYHNVDQGRSYQQPQRMYHAPPMHSNRNMPQPYNYQPQPYNYNVKSNMQPGDPYNRVHQYQHNVSKYLPDYKMNSPIDQRVYGESMHMNFAPMPPKISPNYPHCSQLEYAQHYQHRRSQIAQEYYPHSAYKSGYVQNPQVSPEGGGVDAQMRTKSSLKQYLETWVEEDISGNLPDIIISNNLNDVETMEGLKGTMCVKGSDTQEQPLYVLDTTEIANENLPHFLHLQQFEKLPDNIRGYYNLSSAVTPGSRRIIVENSSMESSPENVQVVRTNTAAKISETLAENSRTHEQGPEKNGRAIENQIQSLENKVVQIHIIEDCEAAITSPTAELASQDGVTETVIIQSSTAHPDLEDTCVINKCAPVEADIEDAVKNMPVIDDCIAAAKENATHSENENGKDEENENGKEEENENSKEEEKETSEDVPPVNDVNLSSSLTNIFKEMEHIHGENDDVTTINQDQSCDSDSSQKHSEESSSDEHSSTDQDSEEPNAKDEHSTLEALEPPTNSANDSGLPENHLTDLTNPTNTTPLPSCVSNDETETENAQNTENHDVEEENHRNVSTDLNTSLPEDPEEMESTKEESHRINEAEELVSNELEVKKDDEESGDNAKENLPDEPSKNEPNENVFKTILQIPNAKRIMSRTCSQSSDETALPITNQELSSSYSDDTDVAETESINEGPSSESSDTDDDIPPEDTEIPALSPLDTLAKPLEEEITAEETLIAEDTKDPENSSDVAANIYTEDIEDCIKATILSKHITEIASDQPNQDQLDENLENDTRIATPLNLTMYKKCVDSIEYENHVEDIIDNPPRPNDCGPLADPTEATSQSSAESNPEDVDTSEDAMPVLESQTTICDDTKSECLLTIPQLTPERRLLKSNSRKRSKEKISRKETSCRRSDVKRKSRRLNKPSVGSERISRCEEEALKPEVVIEDVIRNVVEEDLVAVVESIVVDAVQNELENGIEHALIAATAEAIQSEHNLIEESVCATKPENTENVLVAEHEPPIDFQKVDEQLDDASTQEMQQISEEPDEIETAPSEETVENGEENYENPDANVVYQINDTNVVLQIADELLEINITAQNGRKIILVKTFSDAIIMNNTDEVESQINDAPVEQYEATPPNEKLCQAEPIVNNNYIGYSDETNFDLKDPAPVEETNFDLKDPGPSDETNFDLKDPEPGDETNSYLKDPEPGDDPGPDITTVGDDVCIYNEEVVSSSTEVETQKEELIEPVIDDKSSQMKYATRKMKKEKRVSWGDEKPDLTKTKCLTDDPPKIIPKEDITNLPNMDEHQKPNIKDSLRKIPKTKAALKYVETNFKTSKPRTGKEEKVPFKVVDDQKHETDAKKAANPIKKRRLSTQPTREENKKQKPHGRDVHHTKPESHGAKVKFNDTPVKTVEKTADLHKTRERTKKDATTPKIKPLILPTKTTPTLKDEKTNHNSSKTPHPPKKKPKIDPPPKTDNTHTSKTSAKPRSDGAKKQKTDEPASKPKREKEITQCKTPKTRKEPESRKTKAKSEPPKPKTDVTETEPTIEERLAAVTEDNHVSVQENSITSSTTSQESEATLKERSSKLIKQITDDWDDDSDDLKSMDNSSKRRLSLQEYKQRTTTGDPEPIPLDLTSNLWIAGSKCKRDTSPESPALNVKFNNKTYSRSSSFGSKTSASSPHGCELAGPTSDYKKEEEPLSSAIELHLPKINRTPPKPVYNHEYLRNALMNDLHAVNAYTTTLIKDNQQLMQRFLEQQRLTAEELKKVKTIIRYKRLVQHLSTIRISEMQTVRENFFVKHDADAHSNAAQFKLTSVFNEVKRQSNIPTVNVPAPVNQLHIEQPVKVPEKRKRKRFRFLYSDEETETPKVPVCPPEALTNDESKLDRNCCLKRPRVDNPVPAMDYSVHQSNSQGQLTLVFKRSFKSDPKMQPYVKLERLPSIDLLAKNGLY